MRPIIATIMALQLTIGWGAYGFLLFYICWEAKRLPIWDECIIPFGIPLLFVTTYFGFLKKERKELLEMILQRSPAGSVAVAAASRLQSLATMAKKP